MSKVTFDWANKRINVNADTVSLNVEQDLYSEWKIWARLDSNLWYLSAFRTFGWDPTIPWQSAPKYFFLTNWWRCVVDWIDVIVATNLYTDELDFPFIKLNWGSVSLTNSDIAISDQEAIQYASFGWAVNVDVNSWRSWTSYPTGNAEFPVDNMQDAILIAEERWFHKIKIYSNMILDTWDNVEEYVLEWLSHVNTELTINPWANCLRTTFQNFRLTWTLDGDSDIYNCTVGNISYFNWHIHDSYLFWNLILEWTEDAKIDNCKILKITDIPILIFWTSGQNLTMSNYSWRVIIDDIQWASEVAIWLDSWDVIINNTCTAWFIAVSWNWEMDDKSWDNCYVVDKLVNWNGLANLKNIVEWLRPHHTWTGDIWYWNPYSWNDLFEWKTPNSAVKTFAKAHSLAKDANHDIIYCIPGNPNWVTESNENITISKDYLFLRWPWRDFDLTWADDSLPTVTITSRWAEISGMRIESSLTATAPVIHTTGDFSLFKNVWLSNSNDWIHIEDCEYGILDNVKSHHNNWYWVLIDWTAEHTDIIDCHIGSNENWVIVNLDAWYHEVNLLWNTVIHKNTNYWIDIWANTAGVIFGADVEVFNNTEWDINDLWTWTYIPTGNWWWGLNENELHGALDTYSNKNDYKADLTITNTKIDNLPTNTLEADERVKLLSLENFDSSNVENKLLLLERLAKASIKIEGTQVIMFDWIWELQRWNLADINNTPSNEDVFFKTKVV